MVSMEKFDKMSWNEFEALPNSEKAIFFNGTETIYDCLIAQQFQRPFLDEIYKLTNIVRSISKSKSGAVFLSSLLPHKRAMLYFMQPSTRTYLSHKSACQILGMPTADVRDSSISSEIKGETVEDTIRTFSSYSDVIIMRHPEEGMAERSAFVLNQSERPVPVVNAGSGKDQHPTQALLDVYTLRRSFEKHGGLDGKTILFAGDLLRGRTVRSLSQLLTHFKDVKIIFASPKKFAMKQDILDILDERGVTYIETEDFHGHLAEADAIYMTRVQDEHDAKDGTKSEKSFPEFSLLEEHLPQLKKHCAILHPLPRRDELDDKIDHDPRAKYWRQERNGMWTRTALLAMIMRADKEILAYWKEISSQARHTADI